VVEQTHGIVISPQEIVVPAAIMVAEKESEWSRDLR